jgi:UDP-N-acetylmuramoyl-tripeptide--D-alanyl-D-alanine ligase
MNITLKNIFSIPTAVIYNPDDYKPVNSVSIDSRSLSKNSLFVAIKGDNFDGHMFIRKAIKKGATAVLINKNKMKEFDDIDVPIIVVKDTVKAYGELAKIWRKKLGIKVISITGSNGKTTTKELLVTLLKEKYNVQYTIANNNNHIGVPLTLLSAKKSCDVLVLEHGTNHFNEIEYTAKIALPDYSMITNIGDSHLEYLVDRNGVYKEKASLFEETISNNGKVFLNNDDPIIRLNKNKYKSKITYGFKYNPIVKGSIIGYTKDGRTRVNITYKERTLNAELPIYGSVSAKNFLASAAVALELGLSKKQILKGVKNLKLVNGRLEVKKHDNLFLIDDTYNANPSSMIDAFDLLKNINVFRRKVLILGDMFELGDKSINLHKELAKYIIRYKMPEIYSVGKFMKYMSLNLNNSIPVKKHFARRDNLKKFLRAQDFNNCVVLIKGSRGMKMEDFVEIINKKAA